jgi:hypothetical protein
MIHALKNVLMGAWHSYTRLFVPMSPEYRYWFRLTMYWFTPLLIAHQLMMSAWLDPEGITQRILISRIVIGIAVGIASSIVGWLACRAAWALRSQR